MNRNSLRCDDILTFYSNESETIVKIGCYVKYSSKGDVAFYSDPQDYKLIYNDNVKLSFTGSKFITITHDNSLGYYRCGVTFEASFKIQGGEKLTSVIIVPFGNFSMHPALSAVHYGQAIFEGIKAEKNQDGQPIIFRPLLLTNFSIL